MSHPLIGPRFLPHVVVPDATMGGRHPSCHDACSSMFDSIIKQLVKKKCKKRNAKNILFHDTLVLTKMSLLYLSIFDVR